MVWTAAVALAATLTAGATAQAPQNANAADVGAASARSAPPTVEQLAAFPAMSSFSISPDGRHLAALEARGEDRVILVWDTDNLSATPTVIGSREMKIQGVGFIKNDVLAVSLWQPYDDGRLKEFAGKLMLTDLEGREWHDPQAAIPARSDGEQRFFRLIPAQVLDRLPRDPDHILITAGGDVFRYNVRRQRAERLLRASERVIGWRTDLTGAVRARTILDRDTEGLFIATQFRGASGDWEEHTRNRIRDREIFSVLAFTADPNIAFVLSNRGRDKAAIFEYNIATRTLGEVAFEHPLFEATGVAQWTADDANFGEIIAFSYAGPRTTRYSVMPAIAEIEARLKEALDVKDEPLRIVDPANGQARTIRYPSGRYLEIVSTSSDLNTVVVWAGSANDPGAYYLFKDKARLSLLSRPFPQIDPATLGETSLVYYKARDGLDIPAFLTKPSEDLYGPGPYPTVVLPHGGPWSRDDLAWDSFMWPQMLASRGYAVLQPQFRGSDGWGRRLWMAGDAEWGQKMQDDKDDGALWLVSQGVAQPGRIAMFGFSYGGYSAMVAAVRPNGIYKCAISGAGVSDITRLRSGMFQNPYTREAQRDTVDGLSPNRVGNTTSIPIMLYHGERDQTAPIEHSEWFYEAARGSGQDVQFHRLADYGHGPAWTRSIMADQLRLIDDYFRTGCGGGGL